MKAVLSAWITRLSAMFHSMGQYAALELVSPDGRAPTNMFDSNSSMSITRCRNFCGISSGICRVRRDEYQVTRPQEARKFARW